MQIENLKALAVNILQPIRSEFDRPLIISSGFRTAELCIEIGSKITSEHCADNKSAAADFEIPGIDNKELAQWIRDNLIWNQLILEFYKEGEPSSGWVHCSYSSDLNRKQSLIAYREDNKVKYKPWVIEAYTGKAIRQPSETNKEFEMRHEYHTGTKGMKDYYKDII
jgi:zinc D-Ala-D-Ala carboxypeptidase